MKTLSLAILSIVLLAAWSTTSSFAQGMMRFTERIEEMKTKLTLSDEQVVQVTAIYDTAQTDIQKVRDEGGDRQEIMMYARERMQVANNSVNALLNEEQQKKFEELQKEWREKAAERMRERRGQM